MKTELGLLIINILFNSGFATLFMYRRNRKGFIGHLEKGDCRSEMNFSAMAAEKGIPEAFKSYAAEDAVLIRNNRSYTDFTDTTVENRGVFHTVWKRQDDGSWKYVWD